MIVERRVHEANLAWVVAEAAKPYLSAADRRAGAVLGRRGGGPGWRGGTSGEPPVSSFASTPRKTSGQAR
jgi:hypothetical protein